MTNPIRDALERAANLIECSHISEVTPKQNGEIVKRLAAQVRALAEGDGQNIGLICPTAPERIWLQVDPEPEDEGSPQYPQNAGIDDVTWCADQINASDTLYIRADLALPPPPKD